MNTLRCKDGHASSDPDFCSTCGVEMTAPTDEASPVSDCPVCGTAKIEDVNFCGDCGYNFITQSGGIIEPPPAAATPVVAPSKNDTAPTQLAKPSIPTIQKLEVHLKIKAGVDGAPTRASKIFPLEEGTYTIGRISVKRNIKPDICAVDDDGVSHRHAIIRKQTEQFFIMDLGSSNGTQLNGKDIEPNTLQLLKAGDRIEIGRYTELLIENT